jgi:glycosyltransferase involved in cell wall biosynthesis
MQKKVTISIGMPVLNGERTLAQAICSIVNQDFNNWELIVIDDGSIDATPEIARSFRDERIRSTSSRSNIGLAARLNEAVALSGGEYFARMDADDISYPHRLTQQLEYLQTHPEVDLVGGSEVIFQGDGVAVGYRPAFTTHEGICGGLVRTFALSHVSWMAKKEWFRSNPYDPLKRLTEDGDLLLRTHRHSRFAAVPDIIVGVRKEKRIPVRDLVRGRCEVAASLARDGVHNRDWRRVLSAFIQISKLGFDLPALGAGVDYRTLKRRVRPLDPDARSEWRAVWAQVNDLTINREIPQ